MKLLVRLSAILLSASCLHAVDTVVGDSDLPQPLDPGFADTVVEHSPFTRFVNLEEALQLTGIAYVEGRPVATVLNTVTKERLLVFEEPNALGWRLTGASAGTDLNNTQIEMMVGSEVITMHYHGQQVSPGGETKGNGKSRLAGDGSGKKAGGKVAASSLLGERGRELYASLSPEARGKFKDLMKTHVQKRPELTPEQNAAYAQKVFARIKESDQPSASGSAKPPKGSKPAKKKQGT